MKLEIILLTGLFLILGDASCATRTSQVNEVLNSDESNRSTLPVSAETFCDIMAEPSRFEGQSLQFFAVILVSPRTGSYLYHPDCIEPSKFLPFEFETSPEENLKEILLPENPEYKRIGAMRAQGAFTGVLLHFAPDEENRMGNYKFQISMTTGIVPAPAEVPLPWSSIY